MKVVERAIVKGKEEQAEVVFRLRENGQKTFKTIPFHNYFYLKYDDYKEVEYLINSFVKEAIEVTKKNGDFVKIILKNNWDRYKVRQIIEDEGYKTFEADLTAVKRFLIDNNKIPLNQSKLEYCFVDIETFDAKPLNKDIRGNVSGDSPILSIAFKDLKGNIQYIVNQAFKEITFEEAEKNIDKFEKLLIKHEKELLLEFKKIVDSYDVLLAWYGQSFDFPFLKDRFKHHNLSYDAMMIVDMDYLLVYKGFLWGSLKSYALNAVAMHELKEELNNDKTIFTELDEIQKIDWREKTGLKKFWQLYLKDQELLKEYNIQDVNLMYMIEQKLNYLHLCDVISKETHSLVSDSIYNSKALDNRLLIEYMNEDLVAPSKPTKAELEKRKKEKISGGYTYVFERGIFDNLVCNDFKSSYPCHIITYNISPEIFVESIEPKLNYVFNEKEIELIRYAQTVTKNFLDSKGDLKKKKYEQAIEEKRKELGVDDMNTLMFKFIREYDKHLDKFNENLKKRNVVATPADINYDTNGWHVHPHRLFEARQGILPRMELDFLLRRDEVKYKLKQIEYHTAEWWKQHFYQNGLKTLANSAYGAFGFKSFRFYMQEIGDSITSAARYSMKKSIIAAQDAGCKVINGDTDSSYSILPNDLSTDELNYIFYKLYDDVVKPFNTQCEIELTNPKTNKKETKKHFIVFEYEKKFDRCIVVAKKRYYYKEKHGDKYEYNTMGGFFKKKDSMPFAVELQKDLVKQILDGTFDKHKYVEFLKELKRKVENFELEEEHIVMTKSLSKHPKEYGGAVIDGKTGMPKVKKDGSIQQRPVGAHVKLALKMLEEGKDVSAGDAINYVIVNTKPRQEAISIEEYRQNPRYDVKYYYERIESPLIEIIGTVYPEDVYTTFAECWHYTPKQIQRLQEKMLEEFDNEE